MEQRIGRLDRIGRRMPVDVVYFRPASGIGADVVRLFERLGLFREPIASVEPQLAHVERALEEVALDPDAELSDAHIEQLIAAAQAARTRVHEAAYQQLHREPYRAGLGPSILDRVPAASTRSWSRSSSTRPRGSASASSRCAAGAPTRSSSATRRSSTACPASRAASSFVGAFDREYAVADETIDFFASGHALVEGLLAHFEEDPKGRVARLDVRIPGQRGAGLVAVYKDGPEFDVAAFDVDGQARPDWAEAFRRRPLAALRMKAEDAAAHDWPALVARLAPQLGSRRPHAIAAVIVRPV